ncbi:cullin-8 [Monosporozyma servazzii]
MIDGASTVSLIKNIVINDDQPEIRILNELFDNILCALNSSTRNEEIKTIMNRDTYLMYIETCYNLLRKKYYLSVSAEKRSFHEMNTDVENKEDTSDTKKLINLSRLVHIFWEYCDEKIGSLLERLIECEIDNFSNYDSQSPIQPLDIWKNMYEIFWGMMRAVSPVTQYAYLNYPQIFKRYIFKDDSFEDYINKIFYNSVKKHLNRTNKTFEDYLKFCIKDLIIGDKKTFDFNDKNTVLRFAYLYNETIDGRDIKNYYLNSLKEHFQSINISEYCADEETTFQTLFLQKLKEQTLLSSMFSPTWMEPVKNVIVKTVLINKITIRDCYKNFRNSEIDTYRYKTNNDFSIIHFAFSARDRLTELTEICSDIIYEEINELFNKADKKCLLKIFQAFRYQIIFFSHIYPLEPFQCKCDFPCNCSSVEIPVLFKVAYIKLFQNEMNLMEAILKYIELKFKPSHITSNDNSHLSEDLELILVKLQISSSIVPSFVQLLFRQMLMNYNDIVDNLEILNNTDPMMRDVVQAFKDVYTTKSDEWNPMWVHYQQTLAETLNLHTGENGLNKFYPFILQDSDIPTIYQEMNEENTLNDIKLPHELRDMWEKFTKEYKEKFLSHGGSKMITPMYGLQYCEVSTPFKRSNGEQLLLELTLYQTCVLNEFNERDTVSFPYLMKTLRMEAVNVKAILNSFLHYGLIKTNEDKTFSINDMFVPDEGKVKHGVLKIVMGKIKPLSRTPTPISTAVTANHPDGLSSVWKRDLIKACVVRTLKSRQVGDKTLSRDTLFQECHPQLQGISVGEFKDALNSAVKERYVDKVGEDKYIYIA